MIRKISVAIIMLLLNISAFSEGLEMHRLNPSLRQHIDQNLQSSVEKEINTDLSSKKNQFSDVFGKFSEASSFADSMKNIDPDNLPSAGINERDKDHNTIIKSIIENPNIQKLDQDDPMFSVYDEITKDPTKYVSNDCKQVIGDTKGPAWKELKVKKKILNTEYEKNLCENLQNQYSCRYSLRPVCNGPFHIGAPLKNVQGNMSHLYNPNNGTLIIGAPKQAIFYDSWGAQLDFRFTFDIDNIEIIDSFVMNFIYWADFVLIKVNNVPVFGGPEDKVSSSIELNRGRILRGPDGSRYFTAETDKGAWAVNQKAYHNRNPYLQLKSFLKTGQNIIDMRLLYGNGGSLSVNFSYLTKMCNSWVDKWEETCTHIPVP